jgi:hypothetical protein
MLLVSRRSSLWGFASALLIVCAALLFNSRAFAQSVQYTQNKPDQSLRSDMRVDPSTLGLNIQVPLGGLPGRGGASLPINLSYSSKQWRIDYYQSWVNTFGSESGV